MNPNRSSNSKFNHNTKLVSYAAHLSGPPLSLQTPQESTSRSSQTHRFDICDASQTNCSLSSDGSDKSYWFCDEMQLCMPTSHRSLQKLDSIRGQQRRTPGSPPVLQQHMTRGLRAGGGTQPDTIQASTGGKR